MYKLEFYVPEDDLQAVKEAVFAAGAGHIGQYRKCAWQTLGQGQFFADTKAHPAVGKHEKLTEILEVKVECVVQKSCLKAVLESLKLAHPYEEVAYTYWPVNKD